MAEVKNQCVLAWVEEMTQMFKPEKVEWITGEKEQMDRLTAEALATGELIELNQEKLPGCYYHRSNPKDVARDEKRTLICTPTEEEAGPTNHWMEPNKMYAMLKEISDGAMKGRTMYVIPFSMGVVGTPFAKYGIELTDSIYVVLNMDIMTRIGNPVIEKLNEGEDFVKCLHTKADMNPENKYISQFPQDNLVWSVNSAYGGNALMGKKCFALRIGSYLGRNEGWLAEHMLILKLTDPEGKKHYVCGAFPSACGKTNLAMLTPPEPFLAAGWKAETIGDDISWLRVGADGRLYAVNPENGFFGVAPGTNMKSNPNAMLSTKKNSIFTNVARNLDDNTVWWESMDKNPPENGEDWKGNPWNGKTSEEVGAHPNSRFTAPAINCPILADEFETGEAVPIDAIIFGGRRAKAEPLVYQARDWNHGVFVGASMTSERTAAANGVVGEVRHDPMAMIPFCGYNMADYFGHWIEMGKAMTNPPKIFHVNWFRTDDNGRFLWPGFGDNMRVIKWMLDRCDGKVDAVDGPLGYEPKPEDIDVSGLDMQEGDMEQLLAIDKATWEEEIKGTEEFFSKFANIPKEIKESLETLKSNIANM